MTGGLVAIRALHFWATAVLVGGGGLAWLIGSARPAAGTRLLRFAAGGAGVTGLSWFAATLASVAGAADALVSRQDWIDFLTAPFGPPWAILAGLSLLACGLVACAKPRVFLAVGAALTLDQAWLGHPAAGVGAFGAAVIAAYVAHVLAGFAWVGALIMLCVCLRTREAAAAGLAIVSGLGLFAVALIVASGCLNAAAHIGNAAELTGTPYGRVLLAKVTLVAAMLALAAFNRREAKANMPGSGHRGSLAIGVGVETLIGLVVLCLAAVLGITDPPA